MRISKIYGNIKCPDCGDALDVACIRGEWIATCPICGFDERDVSLDALLEDIRDLQAAVDCEDTDEGTVAKVFYPLTDTPPEELNDIVP